MFLTFSEDIAVLIRRYRPCIVSETCHQLDNIYIQVEYSKYHSDISSHRILLRKSSDYDD